MKKVISILFGVFIVIGLVACGGSSSDDKKEADKPETSKPETSKPEKACVPAPGEKC